MFSVKPLAAGNYAAVVKYEGYKRDSVYDIIVSVDGGTRVNFKLEKLAAVFPKKITGKATRQAPRAIAEVAVKSMRYTRPLFEPRLSNPGSVFADKEIERIMPPRNPLNAPPYVYQGRGGQGLNICGKGTEKTLYVVDGILQVGAQDSSQNNRAPRKNHTQRRSRRKH